MGQRTPAVSVWSARGKPVNTPKISVDVTASTASTRSSPSSGVTVYIPFLLAARCPFGRHHPSAAVVPRPIVVASRSYAHQPSRRRGAAAPPGISVPHSKGPGNAKYLEHKRTADGARSAVLPGREAAEARGL